MVEQNRRLGDSSSLDITQMIADEDDAKQRAFLIVLNSINLSLMENTKTTQDLRDQFAKHVVTFQQHSDDEAALINKGKGAWKVVAWILGIAQVMAFTIWVSLTTDVETLKTWSHESDLKHQSLSDRIESRDNTQYSTGNKPTNQ